MASDPVGLALIKPVLENPFKFIPFVMNPSNDYKLPGMYLCYWGTGCFSNSAMHGAESRDTTIWEIFVLRIICV